MKSGSVGHLGGLSVGNRPSAPTSQLNPAGHSVTLSRVSAQWKSVDFDPLCLFCAAPRMQEAVEPELSAVRRLIQEEESPRRPESDARLSDTVSLGLWEVIHWVVTGA